MSYRVNNTTHAMAIRELRAESLKLYRDILRATKLFTWPNDSGQLWSDILRKNARQEFEQARMEKDPLVITRLLYVGRDCLNQTTDRYIKAASSINSNIDKSRPS